MRGEREKGGCEAAFFHACSRPKGPFARWSFAGKSDIRPAERSAESNLYFVSAFN
jgi:hypothetical protein